MGMPLKRDQYVQAFARSLREARQSEARNAALAKAAEYDGIGDIEQADLWRDIYKCIVAIDDRLLWAAVLTAKDPEF